MERGEQLTIHNFIRTADDIPPGRTFVQGSGTPRIPEVGASEEDLTPRHVRERAADEGDVYVRNQKISTLRRVQNVIVHIL